MDSIFKVGDVVRIRDLREIECKYGHDIPCHIVSEMNDMIGDVYLISEVKNDVYDVKAFEHLKDLCPDGCRYSLEGDKGEWAWSSPMLELVASAESLCVPTKEMVESAISAYKVESEISAFKEALEYVTQHLGVPSQLLKGHDEKEEHKLELKVKNVKKVKLNFKN